MTAIDYVIHLVLSVILIVGGYQFYFWCRRNGRLAPREFRLAIDERLPYLLLLGLQMVCFLAFPVATPEHWRRYYQRRTLAERFLALVQKLVRVPGTDRAVGHLH